MVTVDKAVTAHIDKAGKRYEILVDADLAYKYKSSSENERRSISMQKILATNDVYHDSKKVDRVGPHDLQKAFGTSVVEDIAKDILKHGDIQLTTEIKRHKLEEREKEVAFLISRNAMDPKTKLPHPQERILNAMRQAKIHITLNPASEQVDAVITAIRPIIPISLDKCKLEVRLSAEHAARAYGIVKEFGKIEKEQWLSDGSWVGSISLSAGMKPDFYDRLNHATGGSVEIREL